MLAGSHSTLSADTFGSGAVAVLAAVGLLMFGAAVALPLLHRYAQQAAARQAAWPQIRAIVEQAGVAEWVHSTNDTGRAWRCDLSVAYHFDGSRHTALYERFASEREACDFAEMYPPGSGIDVYVDPTRAGRAVLHPAQATQDPALLSGLVAMFVVVGGLAAVAAVALAVR